MRDIESLIEEYADSNRTSTCEQAINNPQKATDVGRHVQGERLRMIVEELNRR
jgi:hypothetical protein